MYIHVQMYICVSVFLSRSQRKAVPELEGVSRQLQSSAVISPSLVLCVAMTTSVTTGALDRTDN